MARVDIIIRLRQAGGRVVERVNQNIRQLRTNLEGIREASGALLQAGTHAAALGTAIAAPGAIAVKFAKDFEQSMGAVRGLLQGSVGDAKEVERQYKALRDEALKMGETTQFTANQAAEAITFLQRAGFSTEQVIGTLGATLNLAAVENIELAESADIASNILTGFGLSVTEFSAAVDTMANITTNANTNLIDLGEAMKTAGPLAASAGVSFEETAAVIGTLANAGIKGTLAGTAFRAMITRLLKPSNKAKKAIDELKLELIDSEGKFVGVQSVIAQLEQKLAGVGGQAERTAILMQIFGRRGGPGVAALLKQGSAALADLEQKAKRSGTAAIIFETRLANLAGSMTKLRSATEGLLIKIGTPFLKVLRDIVDWLTKAVGVINKFVDDLGPLAPVLTGATIVVGGLVAALGALTAALGAAGLALIGFKTGLVAVTAAVPQLATALTVALGKVALVLAVFAVGFKIGQIISDLDVFGMKVSDVVAVVIVKLQQAWEWFKIIGLSIARIQVLVATAGLGSTKWLDNQIAAAKRNIVVLKDMQHEITDNRDSAKKAATTTAQLATATNDATRSEQDFTRALEDTTKQLSEVEIAQGRLRQVRQQDEESLRRFAEAEAAAFDRREDALQKFAERSATQMARLRLRLEKGFLDEQQVLDRRTRLLEQLTAREIQLLRDRLAVESDLDKKRELRIELNRKLEQQQRDRIELQRRQIQVNQQMIQDEQRANEILEDLEKKTFGDDIASMQQKHEIELREVKRANEAQLTELKKFTGDKAMIKEAEQLADIALAQTQIKQLTELIAEEERISAEREQKRREAAERIKEVEDIITGLRIEAEGETAVERFDRESAEIIERLTQLTDDKDKIKEAEALRDIAREKMVADERLRIWQSSLEQSSMIAGGIANVFDQLYEATGRKNKAFFIASKAAAMAQATINTAAAVTKALMEGGPILGPIQAAVIAALGGIQVAKIAAQTFAEGGMVEGGSGRRDDVPIMAMGGEYVVKRPAVQYYGPSMLEAINSMALSRAQLMAANVSSYLPSPQIPRQLTYQAGGLVPSAGEVDQMRAAERPLQINNFTDPAIFSRHLESTGGQDDILNIISNRVEDVKTILQTS